ncbi:MAG: Omp28-related outer membrane protein [Bacteroidetes bacterium]|nr:Omp28-related outer membrane protein [Bacteroidota bacterium]
MKIKINYLVGVLFIVTFYSCDKIDAPYREESSKGIVYINQEDSLTWNGDTLAFAADNSTAVKKVLAEDYTGHLCGNCPYAGVMLNDTIKPLYNEKLVVISVHAGMFASPCPGGLACPGGAAPPGAFATDFSNVTGNDWDHFFAISSSFGNPNGMIDRKDYPVSNVKSTETWATNIQSEAALTPECRIRMITRFNPVTHELGAAVQTKFISSQTDTFKLQVVLTEDSIVDWQEWYAPNPIQYDPNYVHRYVLRGGINGSFGQIIATGNTISGDIKLNGFSYTLNPAWNANHCKVVAFIYNATNKRVIQVEEKSIE